MTGLEPDLTPEGIARRGEQQRRQDVRRRESGWQWLATFVVCAIAFGGCIAFISSSGDDTDSAPSVDQLQYGAYGACKDFVKQALKAPATASFPDYWDRDGEIDVVGSATDFTVRSHVDAENSFGAALRTPFTCKVATTDEGAHYRLVDLDV